MFFKEIKEKCLSSSDRVTSLYNDDPDWYDDDASYAFMEDIVSNTIIETTDNKERKKLLDIIEEMLNDEQDDETQTLAVVAVVEPIYFVCGFDFFVMNKSLVGENTRKAAETIKNFYENK